MDTAAKPTFPHAAEGQVLRVPRIRYAPKVQSALHTPAEGPITLDPHGQPISVEAAAWIRQPPLRRSPDSPERWPSPRVGQIQRSVILTPTPGRVSSRAAVPPGPQSQGLFGFHLRKRPVVDLPSDLPGGHIARPGIERILSIIGMHIHIRIAADHGIQEIL